MTFSIAARDEESGAFGLAITTSSLAVGSRCTFAEAHVGAVLTQHRTDPRIGPKALELLRSSLDAEQALAEITHDDSGIEWRQIALLDNEGKSAAFHGDKIYSWHGHAAVEGAIALGNILRSETLVDQMLDAYLEAGDLAFEDRLLGALSAGLEAGGELMPLRSAALLVVKDDSFPWIDLRVDRAGEPIAELGSLLEEYRSVPDGFHRRVLEPETIPDDEKLVALHQSLLENQRQ